MGLFTYNIKTFFETWTWIKYWSSLTLCRIQDNVILCWHVHVACLYQSLPCCNKIFAVELSSWILSTYTLTLLRLWRDGLTTWRDYQFSWKNGWNQCPVLWSWLRQKWKVKCFRFKGRGCALPDNDNNNNNLWSWLLIPECFLGLDVLSMIWSELLLLIVHFFS